MIPWHAEAQAVLLDFHGYHFWRDENGVPRCGDIRAILEWLNQ